MDIFEKNNKLIDLYGTKLVPEVTALMLLDMTVKNGGLLYYLDYGPVGLALVKQFAQEYAVPELMKIHDEVLIITDKYKSEINKIENDDLVVLARLTDEYLSVADHITTLLYEKYF